MLRAQLSRPSSSPSSTVPSVMWVLTRPPRRSVAAGRAGRQPLIGGRVAGTSRARRCIRQSSVGRERPATAKRRSSRDPRPWERDDRPDPVADGILECRGARPGRAGSAGESAGLLPRGAAPQTNQYGRRRRRWWCRRQGKCRRRSHRPHRRRYRGREPAPTRRRRRSPTRRPREWPHARPRAGAQMSSSQVPPGGSLVAVHGSGTGRARHGHSTRARPVIRSWCLPAPPWRAGVLTRTRASGGPSDTSPAQIPDDDAPQRPGTRPPGPAQARTRRAPVGEGVRAERAGGRPDAAPASGGPRQRVRERAGHGRIHREGVRGTRGRRPGRRGLHHGGGTADRWCPGGGAPGRIRMCVSRFRLVSPRVL